MKKNLKEIIEYIWKLADKSNTEICGMIDTNKGEFRIGCATDRKKARSESTKPGIIPFHTHSPWKTVLPNGTTVVSICDTSGLDILAIHYRGAPTELIFCKDRLLKVSPAEIKTTDEVFSIDKKLSDIFDYWDWKEALDKSLPPIEKESLMRQQMKGWIDKL